MHSDEQEYRAYIATLVEKARQEAIEDARRLQAELEKDHKALGVELERYTRRNAEDIHD